jgi:hypothetical protein
MTTKISLELTERQLERLDAMSRAQEIPPGDLAAALVEEGLRIDAHPGIVFRPGPTGRRAGLACGLDVWELVSVYQQFSGRGEAAVHETANSLELHEHHVRVALAYYAAYPDEIDERIQRNHEAAVEAEAALTGAAMHRA